MKTRREAGWLSRAHVIIIAVLSAAFLAETAGLILEGRPTAIDLIQTFISWPALAVAGFYAYLAIKRRQELEDVLKAANARLTETLKNTAEEKEKYVKQTASLKELNSDLIETRSALMNVLEDVEESKRAIEKANRVDAAIFAALREALIAADADGRIFLFNPIAAALTGAPAADSLGKLIHEVLKLMPEESDVLSTETIRAALEGKGGKFPERLTILRSDGRRIPVAGTAAPFLDEDGAPQGIVTVFRDVTVERDVDRQKSGFISIASHQLRTPLSTIRWYIDLLLGGDVGRLSARQKEFLGDIGTSTARMIKLVGDLLNVSRIESGKMPSAPSSVDIRELLDSLVHEYDPQIKMKKLKLNEPVQESLPAITADPDILRQAVGNLLANAINYTPEDGTLTLGASYQKGEVVIEVRDTGIGIPSSQQHRVFERFFRAENAVARETVGFGLGLFIAKMLVEASKGRVWFESKEGKGTAFFIALPARKG